MSLFLVKCYLVMSKRSLRVFLALRKKEKRIKQIQYKLLSFCEKIISFLQIFCFDPVGALMFGVTQVCDLCKFFWMNWYVTDLFTPWIFLFSVFRYLGALLLCASYMVCFHWNWIIFMYFSKDALQCFSIIYNLNLVLGLVFARNRIASCGSILLFILVG